MIAIEPLTSLIEFFVLDFIDTIVQVLRPILANAKYDDPSLKRIEPPGTVIRDTVIVSNRRDLILHVSMINCIRTKGGEHAIYGIFS